VKDHAESEGPRWKETTMATRWRHLRARMALLLAAEDGMSTVEYAIGTIAAAAFGAILYTVVTGDSIVSALTNIISRALNTNV
jgi:O-acetylhomoserine/O-acetylserine sulfhydrylase-like pyridoxal-dependent enzyme